LLGNRTATLYQLAGTQVYPHGTGNAFDSTLSSQATYKKSAQTVSLKTRQFVFWDKTQQIQHGFFTTFQVFFSKDGFCFALLLRLVVFPVCLGFAAFLGLTGLAGFLVVAINYSTLMICSTR
jgi:antibiotic biosynthesis monooxygenase (ABM) superfamily enzyme